MSFQNPLGSVTALSLASNPVTLIAAATMAGVAVTIAAATFTYKTYKDYEEKKHREAIEQVNALHTKHLARINVADFNEIQGFPPIFKFITGKDSFHVESMHLTDDEINEIGKHLPHSTDIALSIYREAVYNAILKLKEYYFSRKERNDITAGVVSYLIYMLQTKCMNFEGYEYDIAYLNAISGFIISYASLKNRENTQHFSRLNPVFSYITSAKQALEKHKEALSLEEIVGELRDSCIHQSNQLIRCITKFFVHEKDWPLIKTVAMDELRDALLRKEYIKTEVHGVILSIDSEINIDNSFFKEWITSLANYYIQTLDPDTKLSKKDIKSPAELFYLPSYERFTFLKKKAGKLTKAESRELHKMIADYKLITEVFAKYPSFVTTRLDPNSKNKLPKMIPVTDPEDIAMRAVVIANFATLIHQIISLQYLTTHLLKSIKQLGELYVKNPNHFCTIFYVLDRLCNQIKENISKSKKDLARVQRADMNTMQLELQELLPLQIRESLETAYAAISRLGGRVKDYRNKVAKNLNIDEPTYQSVKLAMFEVASVLATIYNMSNKDDASENFIRNRIISRADIDKHKHRIRKPEGISDSKLNQLSAPFPETIAALAVNELALTHHPIDSIAVEPVKISLPAVVIEPIVKEALPVLLSAAESQAVTTAPPVSQGIEHLKELMKAISGCIADITATDPINGRLEVTLYQQIKLSLETLLDKSTKLKQEVHPPLQRALKASKVMMITTGIFEKTLDFLRLPAQDRIQFAKQFKDELHWEVTRPENAIFIDDHFRPYCKRLDSLCPLGFFNTDSRKRFKQLTNDVDELVQFYHEQKLIALTKKLTAQA